MKKVFALFLAAVLLAWTSLIHVKLRTPKNGMMWLPAKLSAGTFSLETALAGVPVVPDRNELDQAGRASRGGEKSSGRRGRPVGAASTYRRRPATAALIEGGSP